jgi:hypothetical protein
VMAPSKRLVSGIVPEQLTENARLEQRKEQVWQTSLTHLSSG